MIVNSKIINGDKHHSIQIDKRFDFSLHQDFRNAYLQESEKGTVFVLDLSQTEYMDSSALGMILLLKDYAAKLEGELIISKPSNAVNKILEIAQFHRLMTIVY